MHKYARVATQTNQKKKNEEKMCHMLGHLLFTLPPAQVRALSQEARKAPTQGSAESTAYRYWAGTGLTGPKEKGWQCHGSVPQTSVRRSGQWCPWIIFGLCPVPVSCRSRSGNWNRLKCTSLLVDNCSSHIYSFAPV